MYRFRDTLAKTAGRLGLSWARDLTDPIEGLAYDEGVRESRPVVPKTRPGEPENFGDAFRAAFGDTPFGRANRFLAKLGAAGGFGYGVWQAIIGSTSSGFAQLAATVVKWTAIGAGGGAFFLMAAVAAASIALLYGIFLALGLLLNLLDG